MDHRPRRSLNRSIVPRLLALVAALVALTAAPAFAAEPVFTITGHGFGHGIGMSQYGARGFAEHGYTYNRILAHYYQGTTLGSLGYAPVAPTEPIVRVAVQKSDVPQGYWTVRGNKADLWVDWSGRGSQDYFVIPKGTAVTITPLGSTANITLRNESGAVLRTFTNANWVRVWERDTSRPRSAGLVQVSHNSGPWNWPNLLYAGSLIFERGTGGNSALLHARNHVYLEDYTTAVVPRESPASWHIEALKAQSVAARTYAYVSLGGGAFDVYCTTRSQVYNGWGQWEADYGNVRHNDDPATSALEGDWRSDPAISATSSQVVKYGNEIVQTFFFSTSGGHTENIENVWTSSAAKPYYKGVPDPYDDISPYHSWGPLTFTASSVRSRLLGAGVDAAKVPVSIVSIAVVNRGVSGRAMKIALTGANGAISYLQDDDIGRFRNGLGLYDTWFYVNEKSIRIAGRDRYATSIEISRRTFTSADSVVIAGGNAFADALAASSLAGVLDAPILLNPSTYLSEEVRLEIERLNATKVYVVGGTGVLSQAVVTNLGQIPDVAAGEGVQRIAGHNRFATAAQIAREVRARVAGTEAIVVNGLAPADAVAVSGLAYAKSIPVLLVTTSDVTTPTASVIESITPSNGIIVGGTGVVPDAIANDLGFSWQRVAAGVDRYDTAAQLARYVVLRHGFAWRNPVVASGESLVDALSGGPFAGTHTAPTLFVRASGVPVATGKLVTEKADSIAEFYILGGTGAVSATTEEWLENAVE